MTDPLRVLIVEDSEDDARLLLRELRRSGYAPEFERVAAAGAMRTALSGHAWDIIVSDYMIPGFGGLEALAIAKESGLDLPFILVSNKVSEETLVEAMRAGASDFLMKDRLDRLGPVVKRERIDAAARHGLKQAQIEWRNAFDAVRDAVFIHDAEFRIVRANLAYAALGGLPITEVIGKHYWNVFPRGNGPLPGCREVTLAKTGMAEDRIEGPGGAAFVSRSFAVSDASGSYTFSMHVMHDVTERNQLEEALAKSEQHFRSLMEHASDLVAVVDVNGKIAFVSPSITQIGGYQIDEVLGKSYFDFTHPDDAQAVAANYAEMVRDSSKVHKTETRLRSKQGAWRVLESVGRNALADPLINGIVINARDITERRQAERALRDEKTFSDKLIKSLPDVFYVLDAAGRFVRWNDKLKALLGLADAEMSGRTATSAIHESDRQLIVQKIQDAFHQGNAVAEARVASKAGALDYYFTATRMDTLQGAFVLGVGFDITERKRAEADLGRLNWALRALGQSNSALVHAGSEKELFESACEAIAGSGAYPLAWLGLARDDAAHSVDIVAFAGKESDYLQDFLVSWADEPLGRGPTGTAIRTGATQVTNDVTQSSAFLPWIESARESGLASALAVPIRDGSAVMGALTVYSRAPDAFGLAEVELFEELAADIGYGVASRRTRAAYEAGLVEREDATRKLRAAFESLIAVLAATVERRDPYTAGHQRRVAELASAIGQALGFDPARVEGLHFAATIHDIGKIYVPAEILSRPGKLAPAEFELIKSHVQVGYDIVKDVKFPWQVADMVRQHHERLDGSGYPRGLKGDQILLESRILAVADVVEAMSSHRPYRPGLGIDAALAQIKQDGGTKLDAQVVDACERVFREHGFAFGKA